MASRKFNEAPSIIEVTEVGEVGMVIPPYTDIVHCTSIPVKNTQRLLDEPILKNAEKDVASIVLPQWVQRRCFLSFLARNWDNLDHIGGHFRRQYSGNGHDFNPYDQGIMVNAQKLYNMSIAAVRAKNSNDPNSDDSKRFRTSIFTITKTYVHELGHIFVTFLGQGQIDSPPTLGARKYFEPDMDEPEAGRYVEKAVFGGLITPLRNPDEDDLQAGVLHLDKGDGSKMINQETIDEFVAHKFNLPITDLGPPRDPRMASLGFGRPRVEASYDPLDNPETSQRLAESKAIRWDAVEVYLANNEPKELTKQMESVLVQAAFKPGLLIEEAA